MQHTKLAPPSTVSWYESRGMTPKTARNAFAEWTLGLRLQWNEDFTEDPPIGKSMRQKKMATSPDFDPGEGGTL